MVSRVAVVVSHPIQHFCPQYSSWATLPEVELKVFFASRHGLDAYEDKNFGRIVKWDDLKLDFPHSFLPNAAGKPLDSKIDSEQLDAYLDEFDPQLVIVYGYSQTLQRHALRWARTQKRKVAMIADSELRSKRSLLARLIKAVVLPTILRRADVFLTVGDANESYFRRYGVTDERLVRNFFPIDVKSFNDATTDRENLRARIRSNLGIPLDHTVVLMVGKLVSWKRQRDLIAFSNSIQGKSEHITIMLAGTGADELELVRQTLRVGPGGVIFAGFVPPADLIGYYLAADIYAHCSEVEPHSLAISEAIYSGLPVVLSDLCGSYGPSDDVRPGLNGFVYRCGVVALLGEALQKLASDETLRRQMGGESRKISRFSQSLAHGGALVQAMRIVA